MAHPRALFRAAAMARLLAYGSVAALVQDRVEKNRVRPWRVPNEQGYYGISCYTLSEPADKFNEAPRELKRTCQLVIEAAASVTADVDDKLDALALEIEKAMAADETLGGTASDCILAATNIDLVGEGENLQGVVALTYAVTYYTYAPAAADIALDNLLTVTGQYNLRNLQPAGDRANDVVTLPGP